MFVIKNSEGLYLDMIRDIPQWTEDEEKATVFPERGGAEMFAKRITEDYEIEYYTWG